MNLECPKEPREVSCPKCFNTFLSRAKNQTTCPFCKSDFRIRKTGGNGGRDGGKQTKTLDIDLMKGNVVDSFKKMGLDPMRNGRLRDSILHILEEDKYKIAWAQALTDKKTDSITLARRVLRNWLKEEKYI